MSPPAAGPGPATNPLRLVVFDMDGTITRPRLDFRRIRAEIGLPEPLLENMMALPPGPERDRAFEILERHEDEAAEKSELNEGARGVLELLRARGMRTALVTRNSRRSAMRVLEKHAISFDLVVTREDAPAKPLPDPLWFACDRLGIPPAEAMMVGDYKYDVIAGRAAGLRTALLLPAEAPPHNADEARPDHLLRRLDDLLSILPQET